MSRFYLRQALRVLTLVGLTILAALATALPALAAAGGWMWD